MDVGAEVGGKYSIGVQPRFHDSFHRCHDAVIVKSPVGGIAMFL